MNHSIWHDRLLKRRLPLGIQHCFLEKYILICVVSDNFCLEYAYIFLQIEKEFENDTYQHTHLDYLAGEMLCIGKCPTKMRKAMVEEKKTVNTIIFIIHSAFIFRMDVGSNKYLELN